MAGKKILMVASTGGHLEQAARWAQRLGVHPSSVFVTFKSAQAQALSARWRVETVNYVAPRSPVAAIRAAREMLTKLPKAEKFDLVLSTGAAVALSGWFVAQKRRTEFHYVESLSRFAGPSLTGRILERLPKRHLWSQHDYGIKAWTPIRSLLDNYELGASHPLANSRMKVLVSLGTIRPYQFSRAIETVRRLTDTSDDVIWQLGVTHAPADLPGDVRQFIEKEELSRLIRTSDLVITHSGMGTLLEVLDAGKVPIVLPRERRFAEHVDDHQLQITEHLVERRLAVDGFEIKARDELSECAARVVNRTRGRS